MTNIEALNQFILDSKLECYNNNTTDVLLKCTYGTPDIALDSTLEQDILIIPTVEFVALTVIEVLIDNVSKGFFTIPVNLKAIWLSELMGTSRVLLNTKVTEDIKLVFATPQLVRFMNITAQSIHFGNAVDILNLGLSSEQFLIAETHINPADENSLLALRNEINNDKTEVIGNGTNVIKLKNTFTTHGSSLSKTLYVDNIIAFKDTQKMGTQVSIKKNGVLVKDYIFTKNTKIIYLSEILGVARELLYTKTNEEYEFSFVYDTYMNNIIITGELTNFNHADLVANSPTTYNLFLLADAKALDVVPINITECNFTVVYNEYNGAKVKEAILNLNSGQDVKVDYVIDNSGEKPIKYMRILNEDNSFNVSIDLVMSLEGLRNYISLLRDMGRGLIE